jgi:hypothetical protein
MTDILKDEIIALTVEAVEKAYKMGLIAGARAEREACAKVAENRMLSDASAKEKVAHNTACKNIAQDIRARTKGETNT